MIFPAPPKKPCSISLLALALSLAVLGGCSSSSSSSDSPENTSADDTVAEPGTQTGDDPTQTLPENDSAELDNEEVVVAETPDIAQFTPQPDFNSVNTGDDIPVDRELEPLPSPPLTPAPGADSEPVAAEPFTTTITSFAAVRDPARNLNDTAGELTDEDFEAGPLPPVYSIPDDVDPETNAPPYFVDLGDVEVFAGEELVVLFEPEDPDGGLPGMFPGSGPAGYYFGDNFDGTKSLRWTPLQPDVGIHEFTVTATDPVAPFYRTTRTIRIRVSLPADTSTIRNLPPSINLTRPHTVQVNDPVVAYLKVNDQNGTVPSLEILNLPAGATLTPHPSDELITILHFVPDTTGTVTLDLVATDAEDPTLTGTQTLTIEVLAENDFIRPGSRLRDLASARDLPFGYAILQNFYQQLDGALYTQIAGEEFNIVSTENSMKFDFLNPLPGQFRWAATDNMVQLAKQQNQTIHGHTLVWYTQLPGWVWRSEPEDRELIMREFIDRVLTRYADDIPLWDVVNESLEDDGSLRNSVWYQGMGASYIDIAFRQARMSAPDATLIYNDYDIGFAGPKQDAMLDLVQRLIDAGTPIDGVGFQLHMFADFIDLDEIEDVFAKVAEMDLDIYVTELDVSIGEDQTEEQQAELFEDILSLCLDQPRCKAFQTWGFTDMYSWRSQFDPLYFDDAYQIKPAYLSMQQRLSEN